VQNKETHCAQHHWTVALRAALAWPVVKRSLLIMAVVGSILNIINQGDAIISNAAINWWKISLTYCVPFCVSTYGAFWAFMTVNKEQSDSA